MGGRGAGNDSFVQLLRDPLAQFGCETTGRQLSQHLVEEAEDDQPLGDVGLDAAALEVEALLLVDRTNGAGVAALDVVGVDLQVRHALCPRSVAERQVAVGLEGNGAAGIRTDLDQARVDTAGNVVDRALEQQITGGLRSNVLLRGAEVVGLRAIGEVQRDLSGAAALAGEASVRADPGVVAAERNSGQQRVRIAFAGGLLVGDLPDMAAEIVDREILDPGRTGGVHAQHGHDDPRHRIRRCEPLDHGDLAVLAGLDHKARKTRCSIAGQFVIDHDRLLDDRTRLDAEVDGRHQCAIQVGEQVEFALLVEQRLIDGTVVDENCLGTADRGCQRAVGEPIQVEFGDAAVAPDLLVGGRRRSSGEAVEGGQPSIGVAVRHAAHRISQGRVRSEHRHVGILLPT